VIDLSEQNTAYTEDRVNNVIHGTCTHTAMSRWDLPALTQVTALG